MVRVTASALALLQELRTKARPQQVLRLVAQGSGYQLTLDEPRGDDQVVEHEGASLLHVAGDAAAALANSAIVAQSTAQGPQLAVTTPQPYPFGALSQIIALRE